MWWQASTLLALAAVAHAVLDGPNVCTRMEPYTATIVVTEQEPYQVKEYFWCSSISYRCSVYKIKYRPVLKTEIRKKERPVDECCKGYEPDASGEKCVPVCVENCLHVCPEGYYGDHCLEACNCSSTGNWACDPVRGCVCHRGYIGEHCDLLASDAQVVD